MDQPFVSKYAPGSCVVVQIEPTHEFNDRSGMATSTRKLWQQIYGTSLFANEPTPLAQLLFGWENPPGKQYVSGSQDAIGLTHAGVNRLWYDGSFWPERIDRCLDEDTLAGSNARSGSSNFTNARPATTRSCNRT